MRSVLLFAILLAPLLGGCVRTLQPVLKEDQVAPTDPSLLGKWVSKEGTESVEVSVAEKERTYQAVYTEAGGKKATLLVRLGKVGELTLAELYPQDSAPEMSDIAKAHLLPVYSFMIIRETKPELVCSVMGQDWLKKYLDQHPNELQAVRRDDDILVTSSTTDIQAFLLAHFKDEGAFGEPNAFVRPGDPATQPAAPAK